MKIIFFGSSDFSIQALKACLDSDHEVALVVTTPDQKKGRGLKLSPTVVAQFAESKGVAVEKFPKLKDENAVQRAKDLAPDCFVVSSYGKLIPSSWLEIPKQLRLNIHPSLLPKYRGASPLNQPILNGDNETGLSIADVTKDLDAGDLYFQQMIPLDDRIDLPKLSQVLSDLSYEAVLTVLRQIEMGSLERTKQDDSQSSYAPKLTKDLGEVSWQDTAQTVERKIRGLKPWPGTYVNLASGPLLILDGKPNGQDLTGEPGTLLAIDKDGSIVVAMGEGALRIARVRPAGKKEMSGSDFANGKRLKTGSKLV